MPRVPYGLVFGLVTLLASCGDDGSTSSAVAEDAGSGETLDTAVADAERDASTGSDVPPVDAGGTPDADAGWGTACESDDACRAPADYCVLQPGESTGYCGAQCANTDACAELGAPAGWTCNTVEFLGCDDASTNWCAPPEELSENAAFLIECTE